MISAGKEFIDTTTSKETVVACIRQIAGTGNRDPVAEKTLEKLGFIFLRYSGFTIRESCDTIGISLQTGYNWQNSWNESGMESLHPRYAGGRPSRLDEDDKRVLSAYVLANCPSTRSVNAFIEDRFGISYSEKQVHTIMKSLGFEHVSEKKLDRVFEKDPGCSGKALMRWVAPESRRNLSRN